ncbi:YVTN family beta-propeller repeat protein [Mesorhizobium sp. PUT5]|uniref:YncE family protein n=1 Tax=Mesorhizobium sp. PUT5 TaxID=3454629 RepID=UPI003FA4A4F1
MTRNHLNNTTAIAASLSEDRTTIPRRAAILALIAASAMALAMSFTSVAKAEPAATGIVYTADEYGNSVSRIDLGSGKVDIVPVDITPHNVQFVPGSNLLLAVGVPLLDGKEETHGNSSGGHGSSMAAGELILLNTADILSGSKVSIAVGGHPAHVIADAEGNRAYVSNSEDDTVSVIDLEKGEAVATVSTGDYPHGLRMSPDGKSIYVANVEDGTVSVIDTDSLSEVARIKVGTAPVQVGFTPDGSRVYVSLRDENKVAVIDTATRRVTARIDVGRAPIQVHATSDSRYVYVANQGTETKPDDTVSVIDVASGKVVKTIRTGAGAHGVTVSGNGEFVFVTNIIDGTVSEISVESQSVVRTYRVGKGPNGITYQAR